MDNPRATITIVGSAASTAYAALARTTLLGFAVKYATLLKYTNIRFVANQQTDAAQYFGFRSPYGAFGVLADIVQLCSSAHHSTYHFIMHASGRAQPSQQAVDCANSDADRILAANARIFGGDLGPNELLVSVTGASGVVFECLNDACMINGDVLRDAVCEAANAQGDVPEC